MNIRKIVAGLIASRAITKGAKTKIKLGGESSKYTVVSDGEKIWYELTVNIIDYVDKNVYRKTHNKYNIPAGKEPTSNISPRDLVGMYKEYLIESTVVYVDGNNNTIEWHESMQDPANNR